MTDRELDARVATEVMGWVVAWSDADMPEGWQLSDYQEHPSYSSGTFNFSLPRFSTRIDDAWQVVEHLIDPDGPYGPQKWSFGLEYSSVVDWVADFTPRARHPKAREYPAFQASAMMASEAICLAALAALEAKS